MSQNVEISRNENTDITTWKINGITLSFDANDADDAERFENAIENSEMRRIFRESEEEVKSYANTVSCLETFLTVCLVTELLKKSG